MTNIEKMIRLQNILDKIRQTGQPDTIYFDGEKRNINVSESQDSWTLEGYIEDNRRRLFPFNLCVRDSIELPRIIYRIEFEGSQFIKEII